jgi:hypothetical protein
MLLGDSDGSEQVSHCRRMDAAIQQVGHRDGYRVVKKPAAKAARVSGSPTMSHK